MKNANVLSITPTESESSPRENITILRGGNNMNNKAVREKTIELIDECQFGCALEVSENFEEKARILQGLLVENLDGAIQGLVDAYTEPWAYSREVVVDLVTTINEINKFDFVVEQGNFCDVFRANETLNEIFIVEKTEELSHEELVDKWINSEECIDDNFGEAYL